MMPLLSFASGLLGSRPLSVSMLLRVASRANTQQHEMQLQLCDPQFFRSPLFWAVIGCGGYGGCWVIEALLRAGADIEEERFGVTPLFVATQNGRMDAVVTLLEFGAEWRGKHLWECAIENGHSDMCEHLAGIGWTCFAG